MTVEQRLKEAEQAYHDLNTGSAVKVFVDQNGERVEYSTVKKADLQRYIMELRAQIAPIAISIPRPLGFFF